MKLATAGTALVFRIGAVAVCAALSIIPAYPQSVAPSAPADPPLAPSISASAEAYRIRVENSMYGRIEVSLDSGMHYYLIGRVTHPATSGIPLPGAAANRIARASDSGIAFTIGRARALKLLPAKKARGAGRPAKWEIITNLPPAGGGLFQDLLPRAASPALIETGPRSAEPFPEGYVLNSETAFVFPVQIAIPAAAAGSPILTSAQRALKTEDALRVRVEELARAYTESSLDRAHAENRKIVSGVLTLRAHLPTGEPDPITDVTYLVDGDEVAAQNFAPYLYEWNTQGVPNGEHVVEIRGLNRNANLVTSARALVVVNNVPAATVVPRPAPPAK